MNGDQFLNPYHFVPVTGSPSETMSVAAFDARSTGHVTHDRYTKAFSGRLVCRLTAEEPIFIGHTRPVSRKGEPQQIPPFELENGVPAIPAASLRGMISAVAEAASNSALRVLSNRSLSYRMAARPGEVLPALGMIVERRDAKGVTTLRLLPLALPPLQRGNRVPAPYGDMFPKGSPPRLKIHVDGYVSNRRVTPPTLEVEPRSFLGSRDPMSFSPDNEEYWYIKAEGTCRWSSRPGQVVDISHPHVSGGGFISGRKALGEPIREFEFKTRVPAAERGKYIRGILRVLGIDGRGSEMPQKRTHELFIPFPEGAESANPTYDISEALARFHRLAEERTLADERLPFEVKGSRRNADSGTHGGDLVLRKGDIVFFAADPGSPPPIRAIAVSSIWRHDAGCVHDYFRTISEELLPFHPERSTITTAEALFGFVEQQDRDKHDRPARALAGRVRFSFGRLGAGQPEPYEGEPRLLKVLVSPKPPSPPFYFKPQSGPGRFIAKADLKPAAHAPQGRKFYLHRHAGTAQPWVSQDPGQLRDLKSQVQLVRPRTVFYFHVDFDNLDERELQLLCYAIRPSDALRHKLGMGKPIGLGTVRIDPVGLFLVDRTARYSAGPGGFSLNGRRYHGCWLGPGEDPQTWRLHGEADTRPGYVVEQRESKDLAGQQGVPSFDDLRASFQNTMSATVRNALELVGDPGKVRWPVHTPQVPRGHLERETYQWFVANTRSQGQSLRPLDETPGDLPPLSRST